MAKTIKQTFPPTKGDHITTIQILNSTRLRLTTVRNMNRTEDKGL